MLLLCSACVTRIRIPLGRYPWVEIWFIISDCMLLLVVVVVVVVMMMKDL